MDKSLTLKMIESYQQSCETDSKLKLSRNAATQNEIIDLAMDWNQFRKIDHSFSNTISGEMKITNQKSSGRCWGFAGFIITGSQVHRRPLHKTTDRYISIRTYSYHPLPSPAIPSAAGGVLI